MTLRKINEQDVIIETPSGTDIYQQSQSSSYTVTVSVDDPTSSTTVFSSSQSSKQITQTWTVPEDGVYRLSISSGSTISNVFQIKVNNRIVIQNGTNSTSSISTSRVLYAGDKITFYGSNSSTNRNWNVTVRQIPTSNIKFGTNATDNSTTHKNWPVKAPSFTTQKN